MRTRVEAMNPTGLSTWAKAELMVRESTAAGTGWSVGYNLGARWQPIEQLAFGATFPEEEEMAHQADEYIRIDTLMQNMKIMARAIILVNDLFYVCAPTPLQHGVARGFAEPESFFIGTKAPQDDALLPGEIERARAWGADLALRVVGRVAIPIA